MFPVESVADSLFEAVGEAETSMAERTAHWGVARKYWSVEQEHHYEVIGLLIGSTFVLAQAAITQSVSILNELRRDPKAREQIPQSKLEKLSSHADIEPVSGLSSIQAIDAVSNYFKHHYEWPSDWHCTPNNGVQARTIDIVVQLGMSPGELTDNMLAAANRLGLGESSPTALAKMIQSWRETWARKLYPCFGLRDPMVDLEDT